MHWRAAYVQPASCWKITVRSLVISLAGNAALAEGLHGTLRCCLAVLAGKKLLEIAGVSVCPPAKFAVLS